MFWGILLFPLIGALCAGFGGRYFGKGTVYISIFCIFISMFLSVCIFLKEGLTLNPYNFKIGVWLFSEELSVYWNFLVDSITIIMLLVVTTISLCVHVFSSSYLGTDPHLNRFMSYISIFTFFMLILVTSGNFIQLFLGWEGVGICSYLLINFWYTRIQANKSAIKALVINKVGDLSFLLGIIFVFIFTKTLNFKTVFALLPILIEHKIFILGNVFNPITLIGVFLVIGAVGKSAQIGLHTWLPDAMEGPTPVSALIHAATMVTAGIFLIIRTSPLIEFTNQNLSFTISILGSITCFIFAMTGAYQYDLKKIIAYSTCSQLGYMFFSCGLSQYQASLFHITTHAFFKAALFLCAGALIHSLEDEQDIRKMGGLIMYYPFYSSVFFISSLSLAGFPFLSGFYSKDLILELSGISSIGYSQINYWFGNLAAFMSFYYSVRLLNKTFFGYYRGPKKKIVELHQPEIKYYFILTFLTFFGIFFGYIAFDTFNGMGNNFFTDAILQKNIIIMENELLPFWMKELPLLGSCLGIFIFDRLNKTGLSSLNFYFNNFLLDKFFKMRFAFDYIYNVFLGVFTLNLSYFVSYRLIDKLFLEVFGPYGIILYSNKAFDDESQNGFILRYLTFIFLLGVGFVFFFCI
jgi:NADH-ubiquinone oxidoreductase chain 5